MADSLEAGSWIELSVRAHVEAVDAIAEVFRSQGVSGVAIEQDFTPGPEGELGTPGDTARVVAYFPRAGHAVEKERLIEERLWHLTAFDLAPISDLGRRVVREEDWAHAWKQFFHPQRVGSRIVIKPSWHAFEPAPDDVVVEIDPGMAFGTGLHPTTRMCLEALERIGDEGPKTGRGETRILDVGTGSGILAIAAAKLWNGRVVALDTSRIAVDVAAENVRINGLSDRVVVREGAIDDSDGPYDVIVANIIASVVADIACACADRLMRHGRLVVSGIIEERAPLVRSAFAACELTIANTCRDGDWICYEACRRDDTAST